MVIFRRIQCISESWWKSIELDAYLVLNISIYLFKVYLKPIVADKSHIVFVNLFVPVSFNFLGYSEPLNDTFDTFI